MGDLIAQQLDTGRYPDLRGEKMVGYGRHCSPAAWAARAVASRRDGSRRAIAKGAAYRRDFDITHPQRSPEYPALMEHVSIVILDAAGQTAPATPLTSR
jgi:hypothetical protein